LESPRVDGVVPAVRSGGGGDELADFDQHLTINRIGYLLTSLELTNDDAGVNLHPVGELVDAILRVNRPDAKNEGLERVAGEKKASCFRIGAFFDLRQLGRACGRLSRKIDVY